MRPVLTHFALMVRDLDAALAFYREYCGMQLVHERVSGDEKDRVAWIAEAGRERELIFVLIEGDARPAQRERDCSHFGFALGNRHEVDEIASRAERAGCLVWPPRQEPYPVGYYCGVRDPSGNMVEFSFGQPLGPGAPDEA